MSGPEETGNDGNSSESDDPNNTSTPKAPNEELSSVSAVKVQNNRGFHSSLGQGIALSIQTQEVIWNLSKYFEYKHRDWRIGDVIYEVSLATRVSETTIKKVLQGFKKNKCFTAPKAKRNRNQKYSFSATDRQLIDSIINSFYIENKSPEIYDIYKRMKDQNCSVSFRDCGRTTFYKLLDKMGYKRIGSNNKGIERPEITAKRKIQSINRKIKRNQKSVDNSN